MKITLAELKMKIAETLDEVSILELLDIHADELVEAFSEKIEEKQEYIKAQLELDDEEVPEWDEGE
jgi:hypothetical protein